MKLKDCDKFVSSVRKLCTPAMLYLMLSLVSLIVMLYDNMNNFGSNNTYCLGRYQCNVPSTLILFALKVIYISFFTFALNCLCKSGYTTIAWFMILIPFILLFIIIGYAMLMQGVKTI